MIYFVGLFNFLFLPFIEKKCIKNSIGSQPFYVENFNAKTQRCKGAMKNPRFRQNNPLNLLNPRNASSYVESSEDGWEDELRALRASRHPLGHHPTHKGRQKASCKNYPRETEFSRKNSVSSIFSIFQSSIFPIFHSSILLLDVFKFLSYNHLTAQTESALIFYNQMFEHHSHNIIF